MRSKFFRRKLLVLLLVQLTLIAGLLEAEGKQGEDGLPLLIETEWLVNNLSSPKLKVVDFGRAYKDYQSGHIPGAVYLEQKAVWDRVNGIPGMLPAPETVAKALAGAGISDDSSVIIYDGANGLWAARLFWALEYLGHKGVHVLNGGWNRWLQDGGEVQKGAPRVPRGSFTARLRPELLATREWILRNLESPRLRVVDTRSPKEYSGADARSARGGHIPGAVNINWILNITDQKIFLPEDELAEFYDSRGVEKDKIAVTLCQTGVRGAHTYFVLRHLGYPEVRLYDGSWEEWGNIEDTPVIVGEGE